jgi:hypothetical protein
MILGLGVIIMVIIDSIDEIMVVQKQEIFVFLNRTSRNKHVLFLDDHNFINNHPPDLKLVPNDAPCDLLHSALKIRL